MADDTSSGKSSGSVTQQVRDYYYPYIILHKITSLFYYFSSSTISIPISLFITSLPSRFVIAELSVLIWHFINEILLMLFKITICRGNVHGIYEDDKVQDGIHPCSF